MQPTFLVQLSNGRIIGRSTDYDEAWAIAKAACFDASAAGLSVRLVRQSVERGLADPTLDGRYPLPG